MRARLLRTVLAGIVAIALRLLCGAPAASAQEFDFRNLSVGDGLAQSQVYAICQDRRGSIWFATRGGGVSCYDGVAFTNYTEENGLANNYVRAIVEDGTGALWFGTDGGLCRYDGRRWAPFPLPGGARVVVNTLALGPDGAIWAGTEERGLFRCGTGAPTNFTRRDGLPSTAVRALAFGADGRLWVGTDRGAAVGTAAGFHAVSAAGGVPACPISAISIERSGAVWMATYGCGLCRVTTAGTTCFTAADGLTNNTITALTAARGGELWIGTGGGGALRYDGRSFRVFTETEGLASNVIASILEDAEGNVWFGTSGGGVSRFGGERITRFTERQGYLGNWVYAIDQDSAGAIWFGHSGGGVTRYDGNTYARFSQKDRFTAAKVKCIHHDSSGTMWFGTVGSGLYTYAGGAFTAMAERGVRARFINAVAEDARGRHWIATADAGLVCYDPHATDSTGIVRTIGRADGMPTLRVYDVLIDGDVIWAATDGSGIVRITFGPDGRPGVRTFTTADGVTSNTVRSIVRDARGALLFGTGGGGITVFSGGVFRGITRQSDAIPSNNVYALVTDGAGHVWMGTEKGITRLTLDAGYRVRELKQFGRAEGVTGIEIAQNAAMVDRDGNVWFGTMAGAVRYNPHADRPNTVPPRTHLREVRLFFTPLAATPFADSVAPWYHIPVGLELPADQNSLSFDAVGISLRNPERVQYQWKLEGLDGEWSPRTAGATAVYSHLPPGSYTFLVRSYNEDGVVDSLGASFHFVIQPPFWKTWWFVGLSAASILAGAWLAVHSWASRLRRDAEHERAEIELRGKVIELEQQALRLTMNPHFIFNALNSIQGIVTGGDVAEAKRTIARFGRLMRQLIDNVRGEHVTIEKECELLRNYIELEKIASSTSFEAEITVSPDLDPATVTIPPMLVQPLVENAIVHGLRDLDRPGSVRVSFERAGDLIRCTVCDDGVGRARAAELSAVRRPEHTPSALAVLEQRLAIIAKQRGVPARLVITDLVDASGAPTGTCVEMVVGK